MANTTFSRDHQRQWPEVPEFSSELLLPHPSSQFRAIIDSSPGIPLFMGNPNRLPQDHHETFEGRTNDPRFDSNIDPATDPRFDTHINAGAVPPKNLSAAARVLILALGAFLFLILMALMYYRFQTPSPRSPEGPQSRVGAALISAEYLVRPGNLL